MELLDNYVKEFRLEMGMNQVELAIACGTTRENISRIECGKNRNPSHLLVYAIAKNLNKPMEEVFPILDE